MYQRSPGQYTQYLHRPLFEWGWNPAAGLNEFKKYDPFDKIFKVLICPEYLQAMKRRRSSDSVADTPAVLGSSVD